MSQALFRQDVSESPLIRIEKKSRAVVHPLHRPLRILMVCSLFTMAYRIMRTAQGTGAQVYVIGNERSKGFRYSTCPEKFILSPIAFDGSATPEILFEINRAVMDFGIDMVIAGDAPAARTVIGLKDRIIAPSFPMPSLEQFDILNNKWAFTKICGELGIPCPPSRLFETREELLRAIDACEIEFPSMAKALSMDGNHGIFRLDAENARATAAAIDYAPILVQNFIPGEDIGASVYCEGGIIRSYILHRLKDAVYSTFDNDSVRDALTRITQKMGVDGVYNFDMRMTDDGRIYYLECNPRFFFKISLSMLNGVNFMRPGLPVGKPTQAAVPTGTSVRLPKAIVKTLLTPWRFTRRDFAMLAYLCTDPLPYLREWLRFEWEP